MKDGKLRMSNTKFMVILIPILVFLLVVAVIVNVAFGIFGPTLDSLFVSTTILSDVPDADKAFEDSKAMAKRVQDEGTVLLKNEDGLLPLADKTKRVNLFGWGSYEPVYSGYGSGGMREQTDMTRFTTMEQAFRDAGYEVNGELMTAYREFCEVRRNPGNVTNHNYSIYELPREDYEPLMAGAKEFSDYAIVTISRAGGEGDDIPMPGQMNDSDTGVGHFGVEYGQSDTKHYLELSDDEEDMLSMVCDNFDNVVVLINAINPMELGFLDEYDNIKSALWIGGPGTVGFKSVADIVKGSVVPSGRLTDTYAYDAMSAPSFVNFGYKTFYDEADVQGPLNATLQFANYIEGIYVGYRYYETRYMNDEAGYDAAVQYPFGYGLSYAEFDQTLGTCYELNGEIVMPVTVTNLSDTYAGKDVVQIYVTAPYSEGGIEKAYVSLVGFAKTDVIQPGDSATVNVTLDVEDLASYDYAGEGCYVLEAGDYELKLMKNAHEMYEDEVWTYSVPETIVYDEDNPRPSDGVAAVNLFDYADITKASTEDANTKNLSRDDWEGTWPTMDRYAPLAEKVTHDNRGGELNTFRDVHSATPTQMIKDTVTVNPQTEDNKSKVSDEKLTYGVPYNYSDFPYRDESEPHESETVTLADMAAVEYSGVIDGVDQSEVWEKFVLQMSFDDMMDIVFDTQGYGSGAIESIGKSAMIDVDGPVGASSYQNGDFEGCHYPIATTIAATWNVPLITEMGEVMGQEFASLGISGMYGPSVNIHRSPFGGRSWEYYSEDPVISGNIGGAEVLGLRHAGIYAHLKHFAVNEQESGRENSGLHTFVSEQALREIYLKAFEIVVKDYNGTGIMSSFNRIGPVWTGGDYNLCTTVLREEWGFQGAVISDYYYFLGASRGGKFYMGVEDGLYAGNDMWLNGLKSYGMASGFSEDTATASDVRVIVNACKNALYMYSRGKLMISEIDFPLWRVFWIIGDIVVFGAILAGIVWIVLRALDSKKHPERYASKSND